MGMAGFLKDLKTLAYWHVMGRILPYLPMRAIYFLGDAGGYFNARFSISICAAIRAELAQVLRMYTPMERETVMRRTFRLMAKNRLEELLFPSLNIRRTERYIKIDGIQKIDSALSGGKGVILVIAHFGANKHVMPCLGFRGYKINQVAGKPTEWIKILGSELSSVRRKALGMELKNEQSLPANFIYVFGSMRSVFQSLERNEIVCFAVDGGGGVKKERVLFLGRWARVSDGPFRVASRTGAQILPAFVVRQQDNSHRVIVEDPIRSHMGHSRTPLDALKQFMGLLENYVYRYPCHYAHRLGLARFLGAKDPIPFFEDYAARQDP